MPSILLQVKDKNIRNLMRGMSANTAASKRNVALHKICSVAKSSELFSALTYLNQQTWHHHENARTMMLVPTAINSTFTHSGGASYLRAAIAAAKGN